jgi:beta-barrel assembly-enhancing protease
VKYGAAGKAFQQGKNALVQGDVRSAIQMLEGVVKQRPEIEEAQFLLGMAYSHPDINRRAEAFKSWQKAVGHKGAQLHLGLEFHNDGDLKNAEASLRKAIALDAKYQEAWYHLGMVLEERDDEQGATQAYTKARDIDPKSEAGKWARTKVILFTGNNFETYAEGEIVDPATEQALGHRVGQRIINLFGLVKDDKATERIQGIFDKLIAATDRNDLKYRIYLLDTPVVNAYAFAGGYLFITKGMLDTIRLRMGDKDEYYAAFIAHEIAHAILRHTPERLKLTAAMSNYGKPEFETLFDQINVAATRQAEHEADKYGTIYMYRAGYNPRYMMEVWHAGARLFGASEKGGDHGTHEERALRTRDTLIELRGRVAEFERGNKKLAEGDFGAAQRHYEVFLALLPQSAPGRGNLGVALHREALQKMGTDQKYKRTTDIDPDSRAAKITLNASPGAEKKPSLDPRINARLLKEARASYELAMQLDPRYALARTNYGALLLDAGEVKAAVKALERAVKLAPTSAAAWNNLGVAYATAGDAKQAIAALEKSAALDGKLADPFFNLGVVYTDTKQGPKATVAYDEYAKRDASSGWTKLARARKAELTPKKPATP